MFIHTHTHTLTHLCPLYHYQGSTVNMNTLHTVFVALGGLVPYGYQKIAICLWIGGLTRTTLAKPSPFLPSLFSRLLFSPLTPPPLPSPPLPL